MSKKKKQKRRHSTRKKRVRYGKSHSPLPHRSMIGLQDEAGVHTFVSDEVSEQELLGVLTDNFLEGFQQSPEWEEMKQEFGERKAKRLLKKVRIKLD
jgi:hypothetical protein